MVKLWVKFFKFGVLQILLNTFGIHIQAKQNKMKEIVLESLRSLIAPAISVSLLKPRPVTFSSLGLQSFLQVT